jgi:biotin synthase-like enzyme
MTGNYLTTDGRRLEDDLAMLEQMGFGVREK